MGRFVSTASGTGTPGRITRGILYEKTLHVYALLSELYQPHKRHGKLYFVYTDVADCQCFYTGDEAAFRHFRDLERQQNSNPVEMDIFLFFFVTKWAWAVYRDYRRAQAH